MKKILPVMVATALVSGFATQAHAMDKMPMDNMMMQDDPFMSEDSIDNWHAEEGVMNNNLMSSGSDSLMVDSMSFPEFGGDEIYNWHEEEGVAYSMSTKLAYNSATRREYM